MTEATTLVCCDDGERRRRVRGALTNGLDYLEVNDDPRTLTVYFLGQAPSSLRKENVRVVGGARVRDIEVERIEVFPAPDDDHDGWMEVRVDRAGDFSTYRLCIVRVDANGRQTHHPPEGFDPRYASLPFTFRSDEAGELDCGTDRTCPPEVRAQPEINYLAKDYGSFRQLILDRLALLMPDWTERHVPDLGITLAELLAYAGDHLSYFQDAVATEAYLDTARRRMSVRRHARLVDYVMHEGCNARVWVACEVQEPNIEVRTDDCYFITHADELDRPMLREEDLPHTQPPRYTVFEPFVESPPATLVFRKAHNKIGFYTWAGAQCCLAKGATSATLVDPGTAGGHAEHEATHGDPRYALQLAPCDVLIFEEVKGPKTGVDADASHAHRHAVRLTKVTRAVDPLPDPVTRRPTLLVEIEWAVEDALPFPLCLSSIGPNCEPVVNVSVARGNVVLVDHGRTVDYEFPPIPTVVVQPGCCDECLPREITRRPGAAAFELPLTDITFAQPIVPCRLPASGCGEEVRFSSASALLAQDPRLALSEVTLQAFPAAPNGDPAFHAGDLQDPAPLAMRLAKARETTDEAGPAAWLRTQLSRDHRDALDQWAATDPAVPLPPELAGALLQLLTALRESWAPRQDLLASEFDDAHFAVEMDDARRAHLRFGDGSSGRAPEAGVSFRARYRVGNGLAGNIGAETLTHIVFRRAYPDGAPIVPRNPLPAAGGSAPESMQEARARAPHLFRQRLERAITPDDYAAIVMRDFASKVQRAAAQLRWTGAGAEVLVAVDTVGAVEASPVLLCAIECHLQAFRRIAHDVRVIAAHTVALSIAMTVRARPGYLRGHVKAAVLEAFGSGTLPDGSLGYFHPDKLTFGASIDVSRLAATGQAIPGVESVRVTALERMLDGPCGELEKGLLSLGPLEIARLDNDPDFPEQGELRLTMEGGR